MKIISVLLSIGESSGLAIEYLRSEDLFIFSDPDTDDIHFSCGKDEFKELLDVLDIFREWL